MGSYAQCWLDDLFVGSSKNNIDPDLMSLFRAEDKVILSAPLDKLSPHLEHYREELEEDHDLKIVYYEARVDIARDRLDVLGYDLKTAHSAFQEWINGELETKKARLERLQTDNPSYKELMTEHYQKEVRILSELSPSSWIEGLKTIHSSGLKTNYYGRYEGPFEDTTVGYMLSNEWYGFPGYDLFVPLRLAIQAFEGGRKLIYDLTDLIWSDYFEVDDDFVNYGVEIIGSEYGSRARTIVLTEGKTDAWILRESFEVLYPHLEGYYSFLDFESTRYGGGVGNLVNVVKALAGAGIVNNVVALFDNDTAAESACKSLKLIKLPSNIVIRRLPDIPLLESYPTIGPSGEVKLDVNGIASSIELFLGEDVLMVHGGKLTPIQWTGYDRALNRYQGEVLEKPLLHERFRKKLADHNGTPGPEWDCLREVFEVIFNAFVEKNRRAICKRPSEYYSL